MREHNETFQHAICQTTKGKQNDSIGIDNNVWLGIVLLYAAMCSNLPARSDF